MTTVLRQQMHNAGLFDEAMEVLSPGHTDQPIVLYLAGWTKVLAGDEAGGIGLFHAASDQSPDRCFPNP